MLLAAVLSDTVVLTSPTVTDRDRRAAETLGEQIGEDPERFGRAMFEASSDVSDLSGEEIVGRDAKTYELERERTAIVGQVEVVGDELMARAGELREALEAAREEGGHAIAALMVTDIVARATTLLVAGEVDAVARAFGQRAGDDGAITLEGVMSRKRQVAPKILAA
jgi:manganese-dependent inorganic pyrophosphatase